MDSKYDKLGNPIQRLSLDKMKTLLQSINRDRTLREYYAEEIETAIQEGLLKVEGYEIVSVRQKSKGKSPVSSSPRVSSPRVSSRNSKSSVNSSPRVSSPRLSSRSPASPGSPGVYSQKKGSKSPVQNKLDRKEKDIQKELRDYFGMDYDSEIGEGSYGRVIKTTKNGIPSAVKIYNISVQDGDLEVSSSFSEYYYSNLFNHPNILKATGFRMNENRAYMVMPLADIDLSGYMEKRISPARKVELAYKITDAIHYIHRGGYANCDVKPDNILMINDEPYITDLGLTRIDDLGIQEKFTCETSLYRSPEQYNATNPIPNYNKKYGNRQWYENDVKGEYWSTGIVILDLLYRRNQVMWGGRVTFYPEILEKLFTLVEEQKESMFNAIIQEIGDMKAEDYPLLNAVCEHLLRFNPSERDMEAFLNDPVFDRYRHPEIPFVVQTVPKMYQEGGMTINNLAVIFEWLHELQKVEDTPPSTMCNTLDYIIQHAHTIKKKEEVQLFAIVVLWIMERITFARDYITPMEIYSHLSRNAFTERQFIDMVLRIANNPIYFESLYAALPNMILVRKGLETMFTNVKEYISNKRPILYAAVLLSEYDDRKSPKRNQLM